jgi:hypothetical protein
MKITIETIRRIERALRHYGVGDWEEIYLKKTEPGALSNTQQDRKEISRLYSELKGKHSFSDADRIAKVIWMCDLFGVEIDQAQEKDIPPVRIDDPYINKEDKCP